MGASSETVLLALRTWHSTAKTSPSGKSANTPADSLALRGASEARSALKGEAAS